MNSDRSGVSTSISREYPYSRSLSVTEKESAKEFGDGFGLENFNEKDIVEFTLDSSLSYVPIYIHLITFDLEPIVRPKTPSSLLSYRREMMSSAAREDQNGDLDALRSSLGHPWMDCIIWEYYTNMDVGGGKGADIREESQSIKSKSDGRSRNTSRFSHRHSNKTN